MKLLNLEHKKNKSKIILWKIESILEIGYTECCLQLYCDKIIRACVESKEPYYRFNHLYGHFTGISKALVTYIMNLPFSDSGLTGMKISVNPLLILGDANKKYIESLIKSFSTNGMKAYINDDNGAIFFPVLLDEYNIISETDVDGFDDVGKLKINNFHESIYFK